MSYDPPPRRAVPVASSSDTAEPEKSTWSSAFKSKSKAWGQTAMVKGVKLSDNVGGKLNNFAEKRFGTEHFWPVTGDFPREMDKCARILRAFTVDGIVQESKTDETDAEGKKKGKVKVLRKIPPEVIQQARGLAIFTSMRSGIAPFGGAGGAGVVVAKLADGTWSAPASISPNNLSAGLLLGVDVYDCILVIRSDVALDSFKTHKATVGTELAVAAGPYGAGAAMEMGIEKAPVFSYTRSRGMYAGVSVVGQVFVARWEENEVMYHWPGVKNGDILAGKVRVPLEAAELQAALKDAESGRAQQMKGSQLDYELPEGVDIESIQLEEGEEMRLPPLPDQADGDFEPSQVRRVSSPRGTPGAPGTPSGLGSRSPRGSMGTGDEHTQALSMGLAALTTAGGGARPPPLPPRSGNRPERPALLEAHSSTSHYSEGMDHEGPEGTRGVHDVQFSEGELLPPPPGYQDGETREDVPGSHRRGQGPGEGEEGGLSVEERERLQHEEQLRKEEEESVGGSAHHPKREGD